MKRDFAIFALITAFRRLADESKFVEIEPNACLDFISILPSRPRATKRLKSTAFFQFFNGKINKRISHRFLRSEGFVLCVKKCAGVDSSSKIVYPRYLRISAFE